MAAKLVTIGDSLTHGFQHGAIRRSEWSYPALVARVLGAPAFRQADFSGGGSGGPLLDLELLVRDLADEGERKLQLWDIPGALLRARALMDRVEDYWERGAGARAAPTGPLHHNLAVWGFDLLDALTLTDAICRRSTPPPRDHVLAQVAELGMYRSARRVLNPAQRPALEALSQLSVAAELAREEEGIENLIVALGSNNALGTCVNLKIRWSEAADLHTLAHERTCTLWQPDHFARLYESLVERILAIGAKRVFVATVPHVTIAPVTRGVSPGAKQQGRPELVDGYYDYYTRFWIWDDTFDPQRHPHLTREQARLIDSTIDQYNACVKAAATRHGWFVLDLCHVLDELAFRRNQGAPRYPLPAGLVAALLGDPRTTHRVRPDGTVLLDTRYLRLPPEAPGATAPARDWQMAYQGGLFGLDGVHPTTIGYGIIAHEVLAAMRAAGVASADPARLPWEEIVAADSFVNDSPALLSSLQRTADWLFGKCRLEHLIEKLAGYGAEQ